MKKVTLKVDGLSCSHCENAVKEAVMKLSSMKNVSVNLLSKTVVAEWEDEKLTEQDVISAIEEEGYDVI